MWAWIGEFLLLYLIWYYICYEFTPYMALRIWHFCRWKTKVYYFCRKIIRYGISVAKISTYALPGQTLEEITNIFHQFNAWKLSQYYRDILHHFELSWNYRDNRKKHYRSGVVLTSAAQGSGPRLPAFSTELLWRGYRAAGPCQWDWGWVQEGQQWGVGVESAEAHVKVIQFD